MDVRQKVFTCPICGANMDGLHCKITCPVCGYREDCSDAGLILYDEESYPEEDNQQPEKKSASGDHDKPFKI